MNKGRTKPEPLRTRLPAAGPFKTRLFVRIGSGVCSAIAPEIPVASITLRTGVLAASNKACRREPGPLSAVLLTVKVMLESVTNQT